MQIKSIIIHHADGCESRAVSASRALAQWYISKDQKLRRDFLRKEAEIPFDFKGPLLIIGGPINYPTEGDQFLVLVDAYIERTYGVSLPARATDYEDTCLLYLDFLKGLGDLVSVEVIRND